MHSRKLMHRDIKLFNILLDDTQRNAKLADFNIALATGRTSGHTVGAGTHEYMAPEVRCCSLFANVHVCTSVHMKIRCLESNTAFLARFSTILRHHFCERMLLRSGTQRTRLH